MSKKRIQIGLIFALMFVVYNVVLFLLNPSYATSFWVSYGFIIGAFVIMLCSYIFVSDEKRRQQVVGMPLTVLTAMYFGLEAVMGTIFMIFPNMSFVAVFIPQFIVFALFLLCFIGAFFSDNNYKDNK